MKVEKNFDFRKRMLEVHRRDLRDNTLLPDAQEFEISDNFKIYLHKNADEVALTAAKDFTDYLFTSMGIKATITYTDSNSVDEGLLLILSADTTLDLGNANGYRGFRIDVDNKLVSVCGYDNRGISQGLYYLEDCMTFRKAPFLKKGTVLRRPLYSPQMVHSGYKLDYYPNEHLSAIAHEGRDAILVFVNDVDKTPMGYLDFNELIARAARYGLDVYAYSYLKSEKHPDEPDAEAYYEGNYGKLFRMCPGLKGVTLVGESVEFPSKDPHVTGKTHRDNLVDGIPTGKTSPGWYPCMDFPQWLTLIKKIITRYKPDADIVFWTYNWGYRSEEERCKLIDALPEGITLQATFEMFEKFKTEGNTSYCADYTLSFEGYGHYFESEAKAAKKRNIKLYSMTNTGGLTWDFGVIPYEPFPYQWIKRYKKMKDAHDKWGLCGLMECHHYGFYPSFISKLSKWCFYDTDEPMEDILETIVKSEFGSASSDIVLSALEKMERSHNIFYSNEFRPIWSVQSRSVLSVLLVQSNQSSKRTVQYVW